MVIWSQERPPRRGSAPDLAEIVATALSLADQEGLDAVSLRRVATALRSGTASFYRVLGSRDELLERMVDAVLGRHLPPEASGDWRADLAAVARNRRAMLKAHPWLGTELAGRPAIGPNALIHHERALAAAAGYADDATTASGAVETVLAYVLGAAARELAEARIQRRSGFTEEQWRAAVAPYLQQVLDSGSYPHLNRMVHEATDLDADERFERGLACVLTGLATSTS
ncbi:TetR/AcrR family transcriptional regulator [Actinomadura chokoriensis]|uniref:TetR/AcrR family transcriptional regulator n=1 Tax=Actinomadura chokoriensis TaxID=454156 RepID=A0ABV4QUB2_9ACTN